MLKRDIAGSFGRFSFSLERVPPTDLQSGSASSQSLPQSMEFRFSLLSLSSFVVYCVVDFCH